MDKRIQLCVYMRVHIYIYRTFIHIHMCRHVHRNGVYEGYIRLPGEAANCFRIPPEASGSPSLSNYAASSTI